MVVGLCGVIAWVVVGDVRVKVSLGVDGMAVGDTIGVLGWVWVARRSQKDLDNMRNTGHVCLRANSISTRERTSLLRVKTTTTSQPVVELYISDHGDYDRGIRRRKKLTARTVPMKSQKCGEADVVNLTKWRWQLWEREGPEDFRACFVQGRKMCARPLL
ncbi:Hypothetical predicted protein [Paramuricea clavata]|uniref:Uncharacterized protein n=1 Tax=Paramuricea clavata TaxID=317549 RepID=A0A7D9EW83_PARCT|nr:Hypothetical predicted protein [Paramuricea clavata]